MRKKLTVTRKTKSGKTIRYKVKDKGKVGRTPESERWYEPSVETGWKKNMPMAQRRRLVLRAHGGDNLASGRAMQSLANVTTDGATKKAAQADASYFFKMNRNIKEN